MRLIVGAGSISARVRGASIVISGKNPTFAYFGVLELAPALRKHASALHRDLGGADLHLDYYR